MLCAHRQSTNPQGTPVEIDRIDANLRYPLPQRGKIVMTMTFRTLLLPFGKNPLALPIKKGYCEMFSVRQVEPKKKA